ncbi:MAG: asparagine synthase (glutamine-hydrolyzing) [Acidobacteria bacterium]|nr:MAG: asparagine synthase (glutamine-hydrolyzing) [Acidobacteriota bacterium]
MCGIAGVIYDDRSRAVQPEELKRMSDTLTHRGPDDEGFFVDQNVGLAMRRLNVIDLVTGHQPISNEDGSVWIVFNGEIYNFPELRRELESKGHRFSTNTDTETIVHAYEEYGEDCVKKLNGMFAFAIWDQRLRKLMLARDRLGVKPVYYFLNERALVFGSEPKAVIEHPEVPAALDLEALDSFLTFEYVPAPLSIFQGVKKLPAGHVLVKQNGKVSIRRYWEIPYTERQTSEEDLCQELGELLQDSVSRRLLSDVPLGAFLSGGIDSSTIVCLMAQAMNRPVKTFSIGFDDPSYNETQYARIVAQRFGTDHHELIIKPDVVNLVQHLVGFLSEPLADVSVFPTYLVSQLARRNVTVVLSGDGGDELFAGYEWYVADKIARYYQKLPGALRRRWIPLLMNCIPPSSQKKGAVNKLKRFVEGSALPASLRHFRWSTFMTEDKKSQLYSEELRGSAGGLDTCSRFVAYLDAVKEADPLWRAQFADIKTYLVDNILAKVDRMSMANSLEARTPFLDYRVVEFAAGVPSHLKLNGFQSKYLLKRCMAGKLPNEILHRKKEGFSIPIKNWLKKELRPLMEDVLSEQRIKREGLFNAPYIEKLKADHLKGAANNSHQLWPLIVFECWRDKYLH